jgi:hypothetical protein
MLSSSHNSALRSRNREWNTASQPRLIAALCPVAVSLRAVIPVDGSRGLSALAGFEERLALRLFR